MFGTWIYLKNTMFQMRQNVSTIKGTPKNGHSGGPAVTKLGWSTVGMITNGFHPVWDHFWHFKIL